MVSVHTDRRDREMGRRQFLGEWMLLWQLTSLAMLIPGCGGGTPSSPSPQPNPTPNPPAPPKPDRNELAPPHIRFQSKGDGNGTEARRIGEAREANTWGTLAQAMENLRINTDIKRTLLGDMVNMYDSVRPGDGYGMIFLIDRTRFTDRVGDVRVAPGAIFGGYEWIGGMPKPTEGATIIVTG
jgi:hypothetical protein